MTPPRQKSEPQGLAYVDTQLSRLLELQILKEEGVIHRQGRTVRNIVHLCLLVCSLTNPTTIGSYTLFKPFICWPMPSSHTTSTRLVRPRQGVTFQVRGGRQRVVAREPAPVGPGSSRRIRIGIKNFQEYRAARFCSLSVCIVSCDVFLGHKLCVFFAMIYG